MGHLCLEVNRETNRIRWVSGCCKDHCTRCYSRFFEGQQYLYIRNWTEFGKPHLVLYFTEFKAKRERLTCENMQILI